jgi:hypothetical protein
VSSLAKIEGTTYISVWLEPEEWDLVVFGLEALRDEYIAGGKIWNKYNDLSTKIAEEVIKSG